MSRMHARIALLLLGIGLLPVLAGCAAPPRRSVFSDQEGGHERAAPRSADGDAGSDAGPFARGRAVVESAAGYLGTPYRYGGADARGVDCSGLAMIVFAEHGVELPRSCAAQSRRGRPVEAAELRAGDLVFFGKSGAPPSHVGIYDRQNRFIHASTSRGRVRYDRLGDQWFREHFRGARRVLPEDDRLAAGGS